MTYREEDHPRDELGRWTDKGGTNESSQTESGGDWEPSRGAFKLGATINRDLADELPGTNPSSSPIKIEGKKQRQQYFDAIFDTLRDLATTVDVLYPRENKLLQKIKDNNLSNKFRQNLLKHLGYTKSGTQTTKSDFKTPFSRDKDKHEILRQLSVYCYDNGREKIPKGYDRVGHFRNDKNGFDAVVVKNDEKKEIVIAYRGMEPPEDVPLVLKVAGMNYTHQQESAQVVYDKIKQDPKFKDYEFYTTGTSLGGYLAQYVAAKNNLKSATFNAFWGTKDAIDKEARKNREKIEIYPDNIVNYRNKEDFYTNQSYVNDIGLSLETDAMVRTDHRFNEKYHVAENMGDLDNTRTTNKNYPKYSN